MHRTIFVGHGTVSIWFLRAALKQGGVYREEIRVAQIRPAREFVARTVIRRSRGSRETYARIVEPVSSRAGRVLLQSSTCQRSRHEGGRGGSSKR